MGFVAGQSPRDTSLQHVPSCEPTLKVQTVSIINYIQKYFRRTYKKLLYALYFAPGLFDGS